MWDPAFATEEGVIVTPDRTPVASRLLNIELPPVVFKLLIADDRLEEVSFKSEMADLLSANLSVLACCFSTFILSDATLLYFLIY